MDKNHQKIPDLEKGYRNAVAKTPDLTVIEQTPSVAQANAAGDFVVSIGTGKIIKACELVVWPTDKGNVEDLEQSTEDSNCIVTGTLVDKNRSGKFRVIIDPDNIWILVDVIVCPVTVSPAGAPLPVGGEVSSVNKRAILVPWIALAAAIIAGATMAARRYRARS